MLAAPALALTAQAVEPDAPTAPFDSPPPNPESASPDSDQWELLSFHTGAGLLAGFAGGYGADQRHGLDRPGPRTALGLVIGGTLGAGTVLGFQHYVHVSRPSAIFSLVSLIAGGLAGLSLDLNSTADAFVRSMIGIATMEGVFWTSLVASALWEPSWAQVILSEMGVLFGAGMAALVAGWVTQAGGHADFSWILLGPVIGEAAVSVLSHFVQWSFAKLFFASLVPLAVTGAFLVIGPPQTTDYFAIAAGAFLVDVLIIGAVAQWSRAITLGQESFSAGATLLPAPPGGTTRMVPGLAASWRF
jgi:hypothetical protein